MPNPMYALFEFQPRDMWIGARWRVSNLSIAQTLVDVWICLIPCFPLHICFLMGSKRLNHRTGD